jgi:hypothetical protein
MINLKNKLNINLFSHYDKGNNHMKSVKWVKLKIYDF